MRVWGWEADQIFRVALSTLHKRFNIVGSLFTYRALEVMVITNSLHTKDRHTQIDNMKNELPKCKIVDETVDTT